MLSRERRAHLDTPRTSGPSTIVADKVTFEKLIPTNILTVTESKSGDHDLGNRHGNFQMKNRKICCPDVEAVIIYRWTIPQIRFSVGNLSDNNDSCTSVTVWCLSAPRGLTWIDVSLLFAIARLMWLRHEQLFSGSCTLQLVKIARTYGNNIWQWYSAIK